MNYFENNKKIFTEKTQINTKKVKLDNIPDNNKLVSITDTFVINKIQPLLLKNKLLESIEICSNYYKGDYPDMTFREWFKIVNKLYNQIIN